MVAPGSKSDKAKVSAKSKAFGKSKGGKGAKQKTKRILNDREKHALRMDGGYGQVLYLWEDIRRKDKKDKTALIDEVLEMQKDRLLTTSRKPQFARVYQSCCKYGNEAQLQLMLDALKGKIPEIATSPYGHQLAISLFNYLKPGQKEQMVNEVIAKSSVLIRSKYGGRVLENVYSASNIATQKKILVHIFDRVDLKDQSDGYRLTVEEVWAKDGSVRHGCHKVLCGIVERCVSRGLIDPTIMHRLLDLACRYAV